MLKLYKNEVNSDVVKEYILGGRFNHCYNNYLFDLISFITLIGETKTITVHYFHLDTNKSHKKI